MDEWLRQLIEDNRLARSKASGLVRRLVEDEPASEILEDAVEDLQRTVPADDPAVGDTGESADGVGGKAAPEEPGS